MCGFSRGTETGSVRVWGEVWGSGSGLGEEDSDILELWTRKEGFVLLAVDDAVDALCIAISGYDDTEPRVGINKFQQPHTYLEPERTVN